MSLAEKRLFLLDMDGTIYLSETLFDGTLEFLRYVRAIGGRYLFLTNNSSRGTDAYIAKMARLGIEAFPDDFLTSADATIRYLRGRYLPETVYYVCGTESLKNQLRLAGLLDGDVVSGILKREPGEEAGNYSFVLTGLSAADYYTLRLMDDAPQFTILPTEPSWWGGGGERLNPVQQMIERSDGRKMFVTITTQEQLVLSYSELGSVVRNTADDQPRPFTPSLTWNKKTDEVLLRISAEAELNKDAGYVTDSYGNPVYGARTLRFGYMSLRYMNNAGIDAISFSNKNAAVILRLSDFLSADMEKAIKQAGGNLTTTLFRVTIEPVDLPDGAVTGGWNIRTEMVIDRKPTDISGLLPNAQVAVDMEVVAKLLTNLDRYDEKTFDKHFTLRRGAQTQESVFIAPYQDDELEKVAYPSVLFASRYLLMPLNESGVVDVVMVPIEEDAADGSAG